jgi:putative transcriptional regulator
MTKPITTKAKLGDDADLMEEQEDFYLTEGETDWARLEAMTDEEALQNALDDPDAQPLTPEQRSRLRRYPDPKRIRLGLNLTQEQFARRFEIALGTLRDWEQNVRIPDSTAKAYLRVIANDPEGVDRALAKSYRNR